MAEINQKIVNSLSIQTEQDRNQQNNTAGIQLKKRDFKTSEIRAYNAPYCDPLILCFKWIIDYSKPYGLFADEQYKDSALAYLKRIGENERYEMLKKWIVNFQTFIKDFDFLILQVDGLENILNQIPGNMFGQDSDKLNFTIRETSDILIQSLITFYRHIWYDNVRRVEVLPANLRRFDCSVLVFSGGYYNMCLYDGDSKAQQQLSNNPKGTNIETMIFPTIRKLSDNFFSQQTIKEFNHVMFELGDCMIDNEESGKNFVSTVSNEMNGDYVKNNISIKYRFAYYGGQFNNSFGNINVAEDLAYVSALNRANNVSDGKYLDKLKESLTKGLVSDVKNAAITKYNNTVQRLFSTSSPIGNALATVTDPNLVRKMVKNTVDLGLNKIENKVNQVIGNVNQMFMRNFSDNLVGLLRQARGQDNNSILSGKAYPANNNTPLNFTQEGKLNVDTGIKITQGINIYKRRGF